MNIRHDPVPDGRTGPWNRIRHFHDKDGVRLYDPRCKACRAAMDAGDITPHDAVAEMGRRDHRGERVPA